MSNKVKIVGYAKKEFFNNGIEYRNFSPDLVGNQTTSGEDTSIFTSANFSISTNLDSKVDKNFVTNDFSDFLCLDLLNLDSAAENIITKYSKSAKLNLDYDDVLSYAFFGSFREYIRVSLENIIINWPASLFVSEVDPTSPSNVGDTVTNYSYDAVANIATFDIPLNRIRNVFNINYVSGGTIINSFNENNPLRDINLNYSSYVLSHSNQSFNLVNLIGSQGLNDTSITISTEGNPFPNIGSEIVDYHLKPNDVKVEEFFFNLNQFESRLLNRMTIPNYTSNFKVYNETLNGTIIESNKKITWPVTDGYNIDFNSTSYTKYVNQLLELADNNDDNKSNLMVRFLVSKAISEFDSVPDIDGTYIGTNGQKMTSALKIYGREFDEVKNYSDGIAFANTVTYDKKNNTPDVVLKNLARVLGWELTSSISQVDIVGNFLSLNNNYYDGYSRGLTDAESELELWRRIIMNTPWLWKSKGTRKAIEFLFKFIGAPDGLVTFNEYLYVADAPVDVNLVEQMMSFFNGTSSISELNLTPQGFPKVLPNTPEMYFQKAGLWYRQTGGANPDIDILVGNNPHIGPYDGGQAYIDQFSQCLVPNFVGGSGEIIDVDAKVNLFTNYGNGTFDECCDYVIVDAKIPSNSELETILQTNQNKYLNNFPVSVSGCTDVTNTWTLVASLIGETIYESEFATTTFNTAITSSDYENEVYNLANEVQLSGSTFTTIGDTIRISLSGDCEFVGNFFKLELCVVTQYSCDDEGVPDLTGFQVPVKTIDACDARTAQQLTVVLYHDGPDNLPRINLDTVYTDELGTTPFVSLDPLTNREVDLYLGDPNYTLRNPENFLRTDSNGLRVEIICVPSNCLVVTGKDLGSGVDGLDNPDTFWIDGVTETTQASLVISIIDVVKSSVNDTVFLQSDDVNLLMTDADIIPYEVDITILENGGDVYDKEIDFVTTIAGDVTSYAVKFELVTLNKGCVLGTATQIFRYPVCKKWQVVNDGEDLNAGNYVYVNCDGDSISGTLLIGETSPEFCGVRPAISQGLTNVYLGECDL